MVILATTLDFVVLHVIHILSLVYTELKRRNVYLKGIIREGRCNSENLRGSVSFFFLSLSATESFAYFYIS